MIGGTLGDVDWLHVRRCALLVSDNALWEEQDACDDAGDKPDDADVREDVEVLLHDGVRHPRTRQAGSHAVRERATLARVHEDERDHENEADRPACEDDVLKCSHPSCSFGIALCGIYANHYDACQSRCPSIDEA